MSNRDVVKLNLLFVDGCWFIDALPMLIPPPVVPPLLRPCCLKSCCLDPRSCSRLSDDRWWRVKDIIMFTFLVSKGANVFLTSLFLEQVP